MVYDVDETQQLVRSVGTGSLTVSELRDYFAATRADPRVRSTMHRLMDLSGITDLPSSAEIRSMAAMSLDWRPDPAARIAVIAASDVTYGVSMMFGGYAGYRDQLAVFRDEAEALAWLGVPRG